MLHTSMTGRGAHIYAAHRHRSGLLLLPLLLPLLLLVVTVRPDDDVALPVAEWPPNERLIYAYETELRLSDHLGAASPGVAVHLAAEVVIARQDDERLRLHLSTPRLLHGGGAGERPLSGPAGPALLEWRAGAVDRLHVAAAESPFWTNVYRGLGSLLQQRASAGEARELDASGECRAAYKAGPEPRSVVRTKRRCSPLDLGAETHSRGPGRTAGRARSAKTELRLRADGRLEQGRARDTVAVSLPLAGVAMAAEATQTLSLRRTEPHTAEPELSPTRALTLAADAEAEPPLGLRALRKVVKAADDGLQADAAGTPEAVTALRRVVAALRRAVDARAVATLLADDALAEVRPSLLDAVAMCATGPCVAAALGRLRLSDPDSADADERLLRGLAYLPEPDEATLSRLLDAARSLPTSGAPGPAVAQLWATLGALAARHRLSPVGRYAAGPADAVRFLVGRLTAHGASEDAVLAALAALRNAAPAPEAAPGLVELLAAPNASTRVRCGVAEALAVAGVPDDLRGLTRARALRLWQSRPFRVDAPGRVRGLDLLLALHPTLAQLCAAARTAVKDQYLARVFLTRVGAWAKRAERPDLWEAVQRKVPGLVRYPGPPGPSSGVAELPLPSGGRFRMDLVADEEGAVRRSETRADLELPDGEPLPLFALSLFADGLGALGEDSDATAGVGLSVLGAALRPVRLFSGYSGLMSAVWNAPSELTPLLQAGLALVDARHAVHLQNGLVVRFAASGLASLDVSGLTAISLWSQSAETQLRTRASVGLGVELALDTALVTAAIRSNASTVLALDFDSKAAFSSMPPRVCLLAGRPDVRMEWRVERIVTVPGAPAAENSLEAVLGQRFVPGGSFSLGPENERACAELLTEQ